MRTHGTLAFVADGAWAGTEKRAAWQLVAAPDVMIRLKRLFPQANKHRRGSIDLIDTTEVCRDLVWVLRRWPLDISEEDRARLERRGREHEARERAVHEILSGGVRPLPGGLEPARPPRDYQLVAADLALTTRSLLLADDLGLGKSMSGLLVLREEGLLPALIVCPTHLPRQWLSELQKTFPWLRAHIVRTLKPYDPAQRREMKGHDPDVLITSYSKLRGWGDHLAGKVRTVIFDEAQELRRANSDKYTAAAQIADQADIRVGLTATPVYNYGGEIHNLMSVLAPDALGSREEFGREWCAGYWSDKVSVDDPAALGAHLRDQGLMLRRTRKEVGRELPDVVRVPHSVDADEEVVDRLAGDAAVDLAELIVAHTAPRQEIWQASGDLDWRMRHATGVAKAPYVAEFVRMLLESGEKVVLYGWHRDVYEVWGDKLKEFDPAFYTGTESPAAKAESVARFVGGEQLDEFKLEDRRRWKLTETPLLIISLRSGAGLDGLQEASHVAVFGELDWSPGIHDQCIGRLHRDGQDEAVVAYFLVSDHGSDPVIADVLNLKRMQSEPLRDPDAPLLEEAAGTTDRVRRLAEEVLRKRRSRQGVMAA